MAKSVKMLRHTRITANKVSKFKNPRVIAWHLAKTTNGYPTFSVALFKDGTDWIRSPSFAETEIYDYAALIALLSKMSQVWNLPVERFYIMGSSTYNDEKLRQDIASQFTHEKRSET